MPYDIITPSAPRRPILVSVPHCGTEIPDDIVENYNPDLIKSIDDTDWFVDRLYDFASDMGITMIRSVYSRWVIDLNRTPNSEPLYSDGRVITALTPTTDFNGEKIYLRNEPDKAEINRRLENYYHPYYQKTNELLDDLQSNFDHVLFFDAHSIRQYVPGIHPEKFPDLILGDADGTSAHESLISVAQKTLSESGYTYNHNYPFKGGHLTRHFGQPDRKRHGLQLEMSKTAYMDDNQINYSEERSEKMVVVLKTMFENLIQSLDDMNNSNQ